MTHFTASNFGSFSQVSDRGPEEMMLALEAIENELVQVRSGAVQQFTEDRLDRLEMAVEILIGFTKHQILK